MGLSTTANLAPVGFEPMDYWDVIARRRQNESAALESYFQAHLRRNEIRTKFESFMAARNIELRDRLFDELSAYASQDVLDIGLEQYATRGNTDRLRLVAAVLAEHGNRAYLALRDFTRYTRPESIYFVDAIATSSCLETGKKEILLDRMARGAEEGTDLFEKIENARGWFID